MTFSTQDLAILIGLIIVAVAWVTGIRRLGARRSKRDREAAEFAAAQGLTLGEDHAISGRVAGVGVKIEPASITVPGHGSARRAAALVTRYTIETEIGAEWFICARREFVDALPELEREVATGDEAFDAAYRLTVNGEPVHRFWEDARILAALLELNPIWVHARPQQLQANFRKENLTRGHEDLWHLEKGLYAALAISAPHLATRFQQELAAPRTPSAPLPASVVAFAITLLVGSVLGSVALSRFFDQDWQVFPVGFAIAYFPILIAVLLAQRVIRQRKQALMRAQSIISGKEIGPYR